MNEKHLKKIFEISSFEFSVAVIYRNRQKENLKDRTSLNSTKNIDAVLLARANMGLVIPKAMESNLDRMIHRGNTVDSSLKTPNKASRRQAF